MKLKTNSSLSCFSSLTKTAITSHRLTMMMASAVTPKKFIFYFYFLIESIRNKVKKISTINSRFCCCCCFFQSNFIEKLIALSFLHLLDLKFFLLLFQIKNKRESNKYLETFICIYMYIEIWSENVLIPERKPRNL